MQSVKCHLQKCSQSNVITIDWGDSEQALQQWDWFVHGMCMFGCLRSFTVNFKLVYLNILNVQMYFPSADQESRATERQYIALVWKRSQGVKMTECICNTHGDLLPDKSMLWVWWLHGKTGCDSQMAEYLVVEISTSKHHAWTTS